MNENLYGTLATVMVTETKRGTQRLKQRVVFDPVSDEPQNAHCEFTDDGDLCENTDHPCGWTVTNLQDDLDLSQRTKQSGRKVDFVVEISGEIIPINDKKWKTRTVIVAPNQNFDRKKPWKKVALFGILGFFAMLASLTPELSNQTGTVVATTLMIMATAIIWSIFKHQRTDTAIHRIVRMEREHP